MSEPASKEPVVPPVVEKPIADKPAETGTPPVVETTVPPAETDPAKAAASAAKPAVETPAVVPEKYDLKIPENSLLDPASIEAVSLFAKENKLTNAQAQVILEREHGAAQAGVEAFKTRADAISQQWLKESMADKVIGGDKFKETALLANDALEKLFPGLEIKKIMDVSGLGNHPTVLKGFAEIGRMLRDPKLHPSGSTPPARPPMKDRMYDNTTSQKS